MPVQKNRLIVLINAPTVTKKTPRGFAILKRQSNGREKKKKKKSRRVNERIIRARTILSNARAKKIM